MKKRFVIFIVIILILSLNGCGILFEKHEEEISGTSTFEIEVNGTDAVPSDNTEITPENIINAGNCSVQGDRIYFCNSYEGDKLYSMNTDGSDMRKLNDDRLERFYVSGDQIYYVNNSDGGKLYAINTNGSKKCKLSDDIIISVFWNVSDGWIYYDNWDERKLYRIKTDGSEREQLNGDTLYMAVVEERIYFYDDHDKGIYSMKTDGNDKIKLSHDSVFKITVSDGWIYFNNTNDDYKLYAMRTDGSERHKFCDDYAPYMQVVDDIIYYIKGDEWKIYSIKTDGSDRKLLSDERADWFIVSDDRIYYTVTGAKIYSMNTDGGDMQILAELDSDTYKEVTYEICARLHESMPEYRFVATGIMRDTEELWHYGYVMGLEVYDENDLIILSADFSEIYYDIVSGYPVFNNMMDTMGLHVADVNFDGYKDVIILNCFAGAHSNTWYDCWLWNSETSSFVVSDSFAQICNPALDPDNKRVYSAGGGGAAYWGGSIYKFIDGEFVLTNDLDTDLYSLVETELVNGEMKIVREASYGNISDELREQIIIDEEEYYRNSELWQLGHPRWYWSGGHHADQWLE